jgi:ribosomal protein S18 acetylase RimI-like enzyme
MLPRLFCVHGRPTSFVVAEEGALRGFLVGFVSQTDPTQAYIHFVGIDPAYRARGLGRLLYERFCAAVKRQGCSEVSCVTAPVNTGSIAFHRRLGFAMLPGDATVQGLSVTTDYYDGPGEPRVLFRRQI